MMKTSKVARPSPSFGRLRQEDHLNQRVTDQTGLCDTLFHENNDDRRCSSRNWKLPWPSLRLILPGLPSACLALYGAFLQSQEKVDCEPSCHCQLLHTHSLAPRFSLAFSTKRCSSHGNLEVGLISGVQHPTELSLERKF